MIIHRWLCCLWFEYCCNLHFAAMRASPDYSLIFIDSHWVWSSRMAKMCKSLPLSHQSRGGGPWNEYPTLFDSITAMPVSGLKDWKTSKTKHEPWSTNITCKSLVCTKFASVTVIIMDYTFIHSAYFIKHIILRVLCPDFLGHGVLLFFLVYSYATTDKEEKLKCLWNKNKRW